jgi:hypothetical protein
MAANPKRTAVYRARSTTLSSSAFIVTRSVLLSGSWWHWASSRLRKGSAGNAGYRQPTLCRLTYRHAGSDKRVTDDWRRIETIEDAEAVAERARKASEAGRRPRGRSKNKSPMSKAITRASVEKRTNHAHSPVSETITTGPVSKTITTSISREGTSHQIDECSTPDGCTADRSRSRSWCARSGALTLECWGQSLPDAGKTEHPRSIWESHPFKSGKDCRES